MQQMKIRTFTVTVVTTGAAVRFQTSDYKVRGVEVVPLSGAAWVIGNATAQASAGAATNYMTINAKLPAAGIKWVAEAGSLQELNLRKFWLNGTAKNKANVFATLEG